MPGRTFTTETGAILSPDQALELIRDSIAIMMDPTSNQVASLRATTELVYTFQGLDNYLTSGGTFPDLWTYRRNLSRPRDVLDMD